MCLLKFHFSNYIFRLFLGFTSNWLISLLVAIYTTVSLGVSIFKFPVYCTQPFVKEFFANPPCFLVAYVCTNGYPPDVAADLRNIFSG